MSTSFAELEIAKLDRLRLLVAELPWQETYDRFVQIREEIKTEYPDIYRSFLPDETTPRKAVLEMIIALAHALQQTLPGYERDGYLRAFHVTKEGWRPLIGQGSSGAMEQLPLTATYEEAVRRSARRVAELKGES